MKKAPLLLATLLVTFGLLAYPRGAVSGLLDSVSPGIRDLGIKDVTTAEPAPEPSIFDNLQSFTGKITSMSATPIGGYTCQDATIKLNVRTGFSRTLVPIRESSEDSPNLDAFLLLRGAPVKVAIATNAGIKTILIPAIEAERFKAVLGILHAARLTNKDVFFQVPTVSVPGCADAFYAADVELR